VHQEREEVYVKYADELTRFATGLAGPSDAADLVSSAMVRCLWSPGWESVAQPRAYLYRAVFNQARMAALSDHRRRRRETVATPGRPHTDEPNLRPEILDAVLALSVQQRAVVVLTYWADLTPAAIGELLDISEGSVRRHLARARKRLREVLRDQ
jgi:RNA polymerase sigma-70 factor (ECF subfamily)